MTNQDDIKNRDEIKIPSWLCLTEEKKQQWISAAIKSREWKEKMNKPLPQEVVDKVNESNRTEQENRIARSIACANSTLSRCNIPESFLEIELNGLIRNEGNHLAFEAIDEYVARAPSLIRRGRGIMFTGRPGRGKTVAAIALLKEATRKHTRLPLRKHYAKWTEPDVSEFYFREIRGNPPNDLLAIIPSFLPTRDYLLELKIKMDRREYLDHRHLLSRRKTPTSHDIPHLHLTIVDDLGSEYDSDMTFGDL